MEIEWKEDLYGIDFINSLKKENQANVVRNIRLMVVALKKPTYTYEELLGLPIQDFMEFYIGFIRKYKKSLFAGEKEPKIPGVLQKVGYQFATEQEYVKEGEIEFSEVKQ